MLQDALKTDKYIDGSQVKVIRSTGRPAPWREYEEDFNNVPVGKAFVVNTDLFDYKVKGQPATPEAKARKVADAFTKATGSVKRFEVGRYEGQIVLKRKPDAEPK